MPEAERLEHAVSDTLVERMAAALGHPAVDPHGDPIPAADGSIHELASHAARPTCRSVKPSRSAGWTSAIPSGSATSRRSVSCLVSW